MEGTDGQKDVNQYTPTFSKWDILVGWLVLGLTALCDNISVYIGPSPKEREKERKG